MGQRNIFIDGVLTRFMGKDLSVFDDFLKLQSKLKRPNNDLKNAISHYREILRKIGTSLQVMTVLETLILQYRTLLNFDEKDIKLNVVREYIYARVSFPRNEVKANDVRVIVGITDVYGSDVKNLINSELFYKTAKEKLSSAMEAIIAQTIEEYNKFE